LAQTERKGRVAAAGARPRSETLDATRAVALIGVLGVNFATISGLAFMTPESRALLGGAGDRIAWAVLVVVVEGKALAAFSLLFGLSFSILIGNAMARGEPFMPFYLRRLAVLGLFGLLNATLFFWGDILTTYAVLGLILPVAALFGQRQVLGIAAVLLLGAPLLLGLAGLEPASPPAVDQVESLRAFASPDMAQTIGHNWALFRGAVGASDGMRLLRYSTLAGLFLLGLAVGRSGLLARLPQNRHWLLPFSWTALGVGIALEIAVLSGLVGGRVATLFHVDGVLMALGYLGLIALLLDRASMGWMRRMLAPLGRMALSGYLMGGLLGQAVFYGWGLGRIGQAGALEVLGYSVLIYLALGVFARIWLRHFLFGPWEWLWRCLGKLEWQPLLRRVGVD